jgi:hypothetical protein
MEEMTFAEALKLLDIEDYAERIFNSHSHGELYFLADYIHIAKWYQRDHDAGVFWFREWFVSVVEQAEREWERPQSIFQHIPRILQQ